MRKALYRTLRPKSWKEVVDKDIIVEVLRNQVKTNNVSHGYLFCGMRGTGKTSCAKILSRAVNCLNPKDGEPCNECKNCKEILDDRAVDVLELDAASNNGVDNIRELKELGIYPPSSLKKKVYIIDEAHMLSNAAFNALLKILEEPPEHLIFILATTDPEKIPETVKSRLQRFDFHGIGRLVIEDSLRKAVDDLGEDVDDKALKMIAQNSGGSMRDALSMLDQLLAIPQRPITSALVGELLGFTGIYEIMPLILGLINKDTKVVLKEANMLTAKGRNADKLLYAMIELLRDILSAKYSNNSGADYEPVIVELAGKIDDERILYLMEKLRLLIGDVNHAFDGSIIFETGLLELTSSGRINDTDKFCESSEDKKIDLKLETHNASENSIEKITVESKISSEKKCVGNNTAEEFHKTKNDKNDNEEKTESPLAPGDEKDALEDKADQPIENHEKESEKVDTDLTKGVTVEEIISKIIDKLPMCITLPEDYHITLTGNILKFVQKVADKDEFILENYKEDIRNIARDMLGANANIEVTSGDKNLDKLKEIFGDKLIIEK